MAGEAFFRKLNEIQRQIPAMAKRLPGVAKVEGLKFIADNFKNEGFEVQKGRHKVWPRKKKGSKRDLIGEKRGGSLRKSWQQDTKTTPTRTEFTSQLPYAAVHNEGLKAGRPPGFTMPERKMIGPSDALDKRIEDKFDRMANDIFK